MVKLISEKQKNSPFPKKKSLVRLTPDVVQGNCTLLLKKFEIPKNKIMYKDILKLDI